MVLYYDEQDGFRHFKRFWRIWIERQHLNQVDTLLLALNSFCDTSILIEKLSVGNDVAELFILVGKNAIDIVGVMLFNPLQFIVQRHDLSDDD